MTTQGDTMKTTWRFAGGNDIYIDDIACDCARWPDSPILAKYKKSVIAAGYADHNFFHNVMTTRVGCGTCGFAATVTWHSDGTADVDRAS